MKDRLESAREEWDELRKKLEANPENAEDILEEIVFTGKKAPETLTDLESMKLDEKQNQFYFLLLKKFFTNGRKNPNTFFSII